MFYYTGILSTPIQYRSDLGHIIKQGYSTKVLLQLFFEANNKSRAYKPPYEANPLPGFITFF